MELLIRETDSSGLTRSQIEDAVRRSIAGKTLRKVLLIPPDYTRLYSNAGLITNLYYHILSDSGAAVDIMPALGSHVPVTAAEAADMFGDIPYEKFLVHNWRTDVVKIGEVPGSFLSEITEGLWDEPIAVEINQKLMDPSYDLIISIGQVVPHEVIGMSNHAKNLFVGVGGSEMINKSHMVGAVYGMERMMGRDHTPVRKIFDHALRQFLADRPILFVLTVTSVRLGAAATHGLFIGDTRKVLEEAIALSQEKNIIYPEHRLKKCVVWLDPKEFKTTWLGNKAIYRTRMAVADGGDLIILGPGIERFGEDPIMDRLIRKYGYRGRLEILRLFKENQDLRDNMGAAAHLIHGSSDGRFRITYAVKKISKEEIESVNFLAADFDELSRIYDPEKMTEGYNRLDNGEEIYFIHQPAVGLWIARE